MKILILIFLILFGVAQASTYSETISSKMIHLSTAIYGINKADQRANRCRKCYQGFKVYKQILGNKILALVGVDAELESVVVVFRGSFNIQNWLTDFNVLMVPYKEDGKNCKRCTVHQGFYNSYHKLVDKHLQTAIKEALQAHPTYELIFTGHSLGGAVANLAAASARLKFPDVEVSLYTCGQPRVGNDKYAAYLDKLLPSNFRVVNKRDLVPHKPAYMAFYRHSGIEIWYKDGMLGDYIVCQGESNFCSNGLGNLNINYNVLDHLFTDYIKLRRKVNSNIVISSSEILDEKFIEQQNLGSLEEGNLQEPNDLFVDQEEDL